MGPARDVEATAAMTIAKEVKETMLMNELIIERNKAIEQSLRQAEKKESGGEDLERKPSQYTRLYMSGEK